MNARLRAEDREVAGLSLSAVMCCECSRIEPVYPNPSKPAPLGSAAPLHRAIISAKPEQSVVKGRVRGGVSG
ncbi:MAG: hypothetical protein ACRDN1_14575 [Trebonia sp.]